MNDLLAVLRPYVHQYGYWAVFTAILLEDFGLPLPGETLLIAGAVLASQGTLEIAPLLLTAWIAAVTGDNIGYAIGRFGGRRLVLRYGVYFFLTKERLLYVENFFQRHGGEAVVAFARFFAILRQLNGIFAGIARMPWQRFLGFNALGAALWCGFWGILFYALGSGAYRFGEYFKDFSFALMLLFVIGAAAIYLYRRR